MAVRHEEKYIISYRQYLLVKQRAMALLTPDAHGDSGSYLVTSVYFDDLHDTALAEKQDGLALHRKFRLRSYDCSGAVIKLERKDKRGILTEKQTAALRPEELAALSDGDLSRLTGKAYDLAAQIRAGGLRPVVAVRYERDAFFHAGSDFRLTFDRRVEALGPDFCCLTEAEVPGVPVLGGDQVIMEIKYGERIPVFARKLTHIDGQQLSVSKYALCREGLL